MRARNPQLPVNDLPEIPVLEDEPKGPKYWLGGAPDKCDIGMEPITDVFVDGATRFGPWGCLCPSCHAQYGYGLGVGRGQLYQLQSDGKWLKTKG